MLYYIILYSIIFYYIYILHYITVYVPFTSKIFTSRSPKRTPNGHPDRVDLRDGRPEVVGQPPGQTSNWGRLRSYKAVKIYELGVYIYNGVAIANSYNYIWWL